MDTEIKEVIEKITSIEELEEISKLVSLRINKLDKKQGLWHIGQEVILKENEENKKHKLYGKIGKIYIIKKNRLMIEFEDGLIYDCPKQRMIAK